MRRKYLNKKPKRKSPKRKSPKRNSPKRNSPKRKSPKRKSPKISLKKLQEFATSMGIDIYSHKKLKEGKKPKKVKAETLLKRLKMEGIDLSPLKIKQVKIQPDVEPKLFEETNIEENSDDESEQIYESEVESDSEESSEGNLDEDDETLARQQMYDQMYNSEIDDEISMLFGRRRFKMPSITHMKKLYSKTKEGLTEVSDGLDKGKKVKDQVKNIANSFGMRRSLAGRRPRHSWKHMGKVLIRGKERELFKGKGGGLFYLKRNNKIYVTDRKLKKPKSPKKSKK